MDENERIETVSNRRENRPSPTLHVIGWEYGSGGKNKVSIEPMRVYDAKKQAERMDGIACGYIRTGCSKCELCKYEARRAKHQYPCNQCKDYADSIGKMAAHDVIIYGLDASDRRMAKKSMYQSRQYR